MNESRIGVYVCWCGSNIGLMVDVEKVTRDVAQLPGVVVSKDYKYMCSDPGQEMIINDIYKHNLDRVVVASCSPHLHERTFRNALERANLNPYMFEMANIREQVSWVHTNRVAATEKARSLIAGAVRRVKHHESLDKRFVDINPDTLVIGGGIAGMTSALEIADAGYKVYLVEKQDRLGGIANKLDLTFPYMSSAKQLIKPIIKKVEDHSNIKIFFNSTVTELSGYIGNYETILNRDNSNKMHLRFGSIVVATGLQPFNPALVPEYDYHRLPDIHTSLEFEEMLSKGKILTEEGNEPKNIAIIHCVGSRSEKYNEYCSRICCMVALKFANQVRSAIPDANIFNVYSDMRSFGKGCEEFYNNTSSRRVIFLAFDEEHGLPKIIPAPEYEKNSMLIQMKEILSGSDVEIPVDMVILMVGMEAQDNARELANIVGISMCGNNFFIERHPKLDPVATTNDGVYIVGNCQAPKSIPDTIAQARAAASRVLETIVVGKVEMEANTAHIDEFLCCGCQMCVKVCPYSAVEFNEEKKISVVNEAICKGCGTCGASCPTGATHLNHFTDEQIMSQIEGILSF